jgi:hypothetical protein
MTITDDRAPSDRQCGQPGIGERTFSDQPDDELAYLHRRYEDEMVAARNARSRNARIAHLEMAVRYAVCARDGRQGQTRFIGAAE